MKCSSIWIKNRSKPVIWFFRWRIFHAENDKGLPALRGVSFNVRAGEIVGLAGVAGNGQRELAQVITGLRRCFKGRVVLKGEEISNCSTQYGIRHGLAYVPEDRTRVGSSPNLSVTDNVIMKKYRKRADCSRLAAGYDRRHQICQMS